MSTYRRTGVTWSSRARSRGAREGRNVSDLGSVDKGPGLTGRRGSTEPISPALFCFACHKLMKPGGVPSSSGLCGPCFTRLTITETTKAILVLALFPALLAVAALFST